MSKNEEKLKELAKQWGYDDSEEFVADHMFGSTTPGICMHAMCDYTTDVEPDQNRGYCEICQDKSVKSGLILAGVV